MKKLETLKRIKERRLLDSLDINSLKLYLFLLCAASEIGKKETLNLGLIRKAWGKDFNAEKFLEAISPLVERGLLKIYPFPNKDLKKFDAEKNPCITFEVCDFLTKKVEDKNGE